MIWIADGFDINQAHLDHVTRHIRNAEEFVLSVDISGYQGDFRLEIPEELIAGAGKSLTKETKIEWETFLGSLIPVEFQLIMPLGRNDMWQCTCLEKDLHSPDCVCGCRYCDGFRNCGCVEGDCQCPAICNCACDHCPHLQTQSEDSSGRMCATASCPNPASPKNKYEKYCGHCRWQVTKEKYVLRTCFLVNYLLTVHW